MRVVIPIKAIVIYEMVSDLVVAKDDRLMDDGVVCESKVIHKSTNVIEGGVKVDYCYYLFLDVRGFRKSFRLMMSIKH